VGWETRSRGGRYYTRSRRVCGRVVREYIGSGETAAIIAALDDRERRENYRRLSVVNVERARLESIDDLVSALSEATDREMRQVLEASGYHQHARGDWRRRRGTRSCEGE
jgi:hypothetical protein